MARLNDPPAPAPESIDALKRRFIRQNREIARVNSNQSIRIRNLESEISRLLAENIALREQAITASAEADKWKASHRLAREVLKMKERLEAKVFEMNSLVGELGQLPDKINRRSSVRRRKSGLVQDLAKSPPNNDWRNRQTASGIDRDVQESRMPAIMEDKYYPRRTFDTDEINSLALEPAQLDNLESPELGPPPVAHLEDSDMFAFVERRSSRRESRETAEENQGQKVIAAVNTENRRKRRTSSLLQDMSGFADETQTQTTENAADPDKSERQAQISTKSSVKRKLDVSELEDTSGGVSKELDDFIFQRKLSVTKPTVKTTRFARPVNRQTVENPSKSEAVSPLKPSQPRKILAPKSTNSPAKRRVGATYEKLDGGKEDMKVDTASKPRTRPSKISLPAANKEQVLSTEFSTDTDLANENLQPKTPAAELTDLLSPSSIPTEPSTRQRQIQEIAISNSVEDVLNGSIGRGSRRARAAVSYAEPNLRDKMRRPGKALVDAVEGFSKSTGSEQEGGRERSKSMGVTFDLDSRRETMELPSAIKVNGEVMIGNDADAGTLQDQAEKQDREEAPSPLRGKKAPPARTATKVRSTGLEGAEDDELSNAVSRLSVFDPPSSSPIAEEKSIVRPRAKADTENRPASRTRRHSMQPQMSNSASGLQRPSSAASVREKEKSVTAVRRSASVTNLPPASALSKNNTSVSSRPVAAAAIRDPASTAMSRRRSMMI